MTADISQRQQIAANFAKRFGVEVERRFHERRGRKPKRYYRVQAGAVTIDVMYPTWIVINGSVCFSVPEAEHHLETLL